MAAHQFGTSDSLDAFMFSFGFLVFLATLVGGEIPESFLPVYAEMRYQKSEVRAHRLAVQSCVLHALVLIFIAGVLYEAAPFYVGCIATGFAAKKGILHKKKRPATRAAESWTIGFKTGQIVEF